MMILSVLDQVYGWIAGCMGDRFLYWCLITLCGRHGGVPSAEDVGFIVGNFQAPLDDGEIEELQEACIASRLIIVVEEPVEIALTVAELIRRVNQASCPDAKDRDRFWNIYK